MLSTLEGIQQDFNGTGSTVSLADLIVLGGCAAVEKAAKDAGHDITVPFSPGPHRRHRRSRPTSSPSRCSSRRPTGSATTSEAGDKLPPEQRLLDRANLLSLTAPEMTVLVGGLRALGANAGGSRTASSPTGPAR